MTLSKPITIVTDEPTQIIFPESHQYGELVQAVERLLGFVREQDWSDIVIAANYARLPHILEIKDENSREAAIAELIFMVLADLIKQGGAKMIESIHKPEYAELRKVLYTFSNYLLPLVPAAIASEDIFPNLWPVGLDVCMLSLLLVMYLSSMRNVPEALNLASLTLIFAYAAVLVSEARTYMGRTSKGDLVNRVALEICTHFPGATPADTKSTLESILKLLEGANKEA